MPVWTPIVTGLFTLLCALIFGVTAYKSRCGTLPRNSVVGIRLIETMQSDEAWEKAHRKTWIGNAIISTLLTISGIFILLRSGEMTESCYIFTVAFTYGSLVPVLALQMAVAKKVARFTDIKQEGNTVL